MSRHVRGLATPNKDYLSSSTEIKVDARIRAEDCTYLNLRVLMSLLGVSAVQHFRSEDQLLQPGLDFDNCSISKGFFCLEFFFLVGVF